MREPEPEPERGIPRCPSWLGGPARAAWRIVTQFERMGVLTLADGKGLELLAEYPCVAGRGAESVCKEVCRTGGQAVSAGR